MKQFRKIVFLLAAAIISLAGCSKKEEEELQQEQYQAPFTGEQTVERTDRRPIVAVINNHPLARPQSGIAEADQLYEFLAEGGMTRFAAVFQSEMPENTGPVRSARDYFVRLAEGMDAFFIAHGYSPDAKTLLDNQTVDHINGMQYDGSLFERSAVRRPPHNSYISSEHIDEALSIVHASQKISKIPPLSFLKDGEHDKIGEIASSITVAYSSDSNFISSYGYSDETNRYYRSVKGIDTIDKANERRVEIANVAVMEMNHETIDGQGRLSIDLQSGGRAMLFHEGIARPVQWQNRDGFLVLVEENGNAVRLTPGMTWNHIVPSLAETVTYTP